MELCSFEHKTIKLNEKDTVAKSSKEEIEMTEEEKSFEMSVKENFPEIFENYLQNNRNIQCYFYFINIKDEVTKHLEIGHKEVINTFEDGEVVIENLWHAEFLE